MALESKAVAYLTDIKILTFIPSPLKSRQDASCSKNKYKEYLIWTYFTETNCSVFDIFKIKYCAVTSSSYQSCSLIFPGE